MADSIINLIIRGKDEASGVLGGVQGSVGGMGTALGSVQTAGVVALGAITTGAVAAGTAILGLGYAGLTAAMDMETQMAIIASNMNTTKEAIAPLGDLISELGLDPNLKVTAVEAAQAIDMLARNGLNMQQILDGAAHSTVLLANATGATFDTAANIATDAMAIFNIEAADMQNAVNGIVSVTTASKFGINDYALALAQGGGVAATAGVSFDEFNATIAAISPLFASGSDAGTSFKTMLTMLSSPTDEARTLMNQLGLEFYDAEGNMKSIAAISGELNSALYGVSEVMVEVGGRTAAQNAELERLQKMHATAAQSIADYELGIKGASLSEDARAKKIAELRTQQANLEAAMQPLVGITGTLTAATQQLTEEERTAALSTLFGADAMRAAAALANMNESAFAELMTTMGQTDAVVNAATRMDTLSGVIEIVKGVGEGLLLSFGNGLLPLFRLFADNALALATQILPRIESGLAVVSEVVGGFSSNLAEGMNPLNAFIEAIWDIAPPALLTALVGFRDDILPGLIGQISVIKESVVAFISPIADWIGQNVRLSDVLGAVGLAIASVVIPAIASVVVAVAPVIAVFAAVVGAVALVRTAWEQDWGGIQAKTSMVLNFVRTEISTGLAEIQQFWTEHGDTIMATAAAAWEAIQLGIETVIGVVQDVLGLFRLAAEGDWYAFGETLRTMTDTVWETIKGTISTAVENIKSFFTSTDWGAVGGAIVTGIANGLSAAAGAIADAARSAAQSALEAAKGFLGIESPSTVAAAQIGRPFAEGVALGAEQGMGDAGARIQRTINTNLVQGTAVPPSLATQSAARPVQVNHYYQVTINDTRSMGLFLDYLQSINGQTAYEAIQ
ncbi:MAG: phage tail tape measure protein [Chloroflexi bacterium]|nr:phage tail tape measure protein [Chloroflexota bacterium]